uniref:CD109 antigen n=1 Tax=Littorina littorea TaxID=31216 RepID=A0A2P1L4B1_LITLI|nr:CD109 antigene-like protein 1 [Littorina littorea]
MKLLLLAALVGAAFANDSYVVVAPSKVRPGMEFSVSVNILKATGDVTVTASMVRTNNQSTVSTNVATFQEGAPGTIDLQMPKVLQSGTYELQVSGAGGLTFSNKTHVTFSAKSKSVLIQTDKAMYKPGQTVNFRVLAMYPDLSVYKGNLDIEIYDSKSNKIKQWKNVSAAEGVVTKDISLSSQPVLGDWKIKVTAGNSAEEKAFTIAEYVLPKFEVTVELPSYVLESATSVPVTVKAKYTYGKPVAGPVVVESKLVQSYYHSTTPSVQRTGTLDNQGRAVIIFPLTELRQLRVSATSSLSNQKIKFSANVTESLTGITLNGSSIVQVYNKAVKLEFPSSNPKNFKPGLHYNGYLQVSQPDGLPVASAVGQSVTIKTTVTAELPAPTTTHYYYSPRTMSFHLADQRLTLNDNGLIPLQLSIPSNATNINVHAEFQGASAYSSITKSYSPSNSYIQLFLRSTNQLTAGGMVNFEFKATEPVQTLVYQVMSRGSIVSAGKVAAAGASSKLFSLSVTPAMAPNARIVLYYVRTDGEIVTDSISFDVEGAFQNQVSVSIDKTQAEPADAVRVTVNADPQSKAYLLAVDQSVLLLKSGNDITAGQVIDELKGYDTTQTKSNIVPFGGGFGGIRPLGLARAKRMIWWPYPVYYGGSDANQIFKNAGVVVMTDALVYKYVKPYRPRHFRRMMAFSRPNLGLRMSFAMASPMMGSIATDSSRLRVADSNAQPLKEVEAVRMLFPETWLWSNVSVGADGTATLTTTVPDTITSWVTSAFAINPTTGLGVAPTAAKLRVFRPFFVTLNLPYSVVRGEQVVIQAIVFNYLPTDQDVRVSMAQSQDFFNLVHDANGQEDLRHEDQVQNVRVPAGEGKSVFFPIVPARLGNVEAVVSAQSTQAADAVRRQLLVEAEGVPKEFGVSVLVDLKNTTTFTKTVPISLPPNVVVDSSRARVTAIGDLMGPTVNGLDSLLKMPTGCGEQNMLGMAPDVFVSAYLKATNQLSGDIAEKAIRFMEHGYQRELTYQHKDGSFSAFGDRDPSGSMWLTAFVAKTFHQAKPYIFIDDDVISRSIDWMLAKQKPDGSFPEPGRVIHKNMQGGASNGTGLTAFVLIALLENNDLQGSISQRVSAATTEAIKYLMGKLPTVTDDYILAMTTYALTLAGDTGAASSFSTLVSHAVVKDGLRYWHKVTTKPTSTSRYWHSPAAVSSDVEMTSYALLTYAAKNDFIGGLDVMKWVASQRNPHGGYASTQDTILALQALSEFARLAYSKSFNIEVSVTAASFAKQFSVNQNNALVLQSADLPSVPSSVTVSATGSGIALVEIGVFFNVEAEVEEPTFEVKVNLVKDTLNLLEIETCAKWLSSDSSGMAVQEVGIPSGFEVDLESIKQPDVLKRTELQDRKVILYFDEIGTIPVCTTMTAQRTGLVAKSKPVGVRVYDYYEPENQATTFYESTSLKNSSVCDVCADCDCPAVKGR